MTEVLFPNGSQSSMESGYSSKTNSGYKDFYSTILDSFDIGLVAFDKHFRIQYATASALRLLDINTPIDQSLSAGAESKVNWNQLLQEVLDSGQIARFHSIRYHRSDRAIRLDISCCPVRDSRGAIAGGAVILEDVTNQAAHENELFQAERLISLGKIAGKVAHELNNPMDGILRYLNLALRVLEQGEVDKAKDFLLHSRSGLLRMITILSELLEFSRGTHQALESWPLDRIVEDAVGLMHTHLDGVAVSIIRQYEGQSPKLRNDGLMQVFGNLVKNAVDAMQGKGQLTITIEKTGSDWRIHFQDTGPGVPAELAEMIFQPFFTTKTAGRGSGLGLAICKDLVEKYQGSISVSSPQQGGSIFTVSIPHPV